MTRKALLVLAWVAMVGFLCGNRVRSDVGDPPACSVCDCAEAESWGFTGSTKSRVITVYDPGDPDTVGAMVTDARYKSDTVYHDWCLKDFHDSEGTYRALDYDTSWPMLCKRSGGQTTNGYIATKYDSTSANYTFPSGGQKQLFPRETCGPQD